MLNEWLELPQRLIAFARIGVRPSRADLDAAMECLDQAQRALHQIGQSAIALHPARAALVALRLGYLPRRAVCISAVASLECLLATAKAPCAA